LNVVSDVILDERLFVTSDVSFNSKLFVNDDVSMNSALFVGKNTIIDGSLNVVSDVILDKRLFVTSDVSFNSKLFVNDDVSMNSALFVGKNTIIDGSLNVVSDVILDKRLFVTSDVSFNSKLFVNDDVSMNSALFVGKNTIIDGSLNVVSDVILDKRLFVTGDVSFNSRLFVTDDVSMTNALYVGKNTIIDGSLNVASDVLLDERLFVTNDVSFSGELYVQELATFGSTTGATISNSGLVNIQNVTDSDSYANGALTVNGGAGISKSLFVGENLNVSGNLVISGTTTTVNTTNLDISDSIIGLSSGETGTPSNDSGFIIERGTDKNVFMGWDEQLDKFVLKTTNENSLSSGALVFIETSTIAANLEIPDNGSIGSLTTPSALSITSTGDISINTTTDSTSVITGAIKVAGGVGIAKDVHIGNDLFLKSDGAVLALGDDDDFTITHDGITGATIQSNPLNITSLSASAYSTTDGTISIDGATGVNIEANAGKIILNTTGAVDISSGTYALDTTGTVSINSGTYALDSTGTVSINSSTGTINVGDDAIAQNINIGTGASARTIQIGHTTSTAVNIDASVVKLTSGAEMTLTDGTAIINMDGAGATDISAVSINIQAAVDKKITVSSTGTDITGVTTITDTLTLSKSTGDGIHIIADASFDNVVRVGNEIFVDGLNIGRGSYAPTDAYGAYGLQNTAFGKYSLNSNIAGDNNTATGYNTLTANIYGNGNTAFGSSSLSQAGTASETSSYNTAIGSNAGALTVGMNNTLIGANTEAYIGMINKINNSTAIGYNAHLTESNQVLLGTATETVYVPGKMNVELDVSFGQTLTVGGKLVITENSVNTTDLSQNISLFTDASSVDIGGTSTHINIGSGIGKIGRIEIGTVDDAVNIVGDLNITGTASFGAISLDISDNSILLNNTGTAATFIDAGFNVQLGTDVSAGYIRIDSGLDKFAVSLPNMAGGVRQYIATKDINDDFTANKVVTTDDVSFNTNVSIGGNTTNTGTLDVSGVTNFETDVTFNGGLIDFSSANTLGNWNGALYDRTGGTLIIEDTAIPRPIVHADLEGTVTTVAQNSIETMTGLTSVGTTNINTTFSGPIVANEGITSTGNITMTSKFIKQF
jgi:hypothetical protein